jgi:hypothetical protein
MNWLAEVGNLLVGEPAASNKEEQGNSIQVFASAGASSRCALPPYQSGLYVDVPELARLAGYSGHALRWQQQHAGV